MQVAKSTFSVSRAIDRWLTDGRFAVQRGPLFKLPKEILAMISDELHGFDKLCFAVCCKGLLALSKPSILTLTKNTWQTWAYCRLICVGWQSPLNDLPPGLLTADEQRTVQAARSPDVVRATPVALAWFAHNNYHWALRCTSATTRCWAPWSTALLTLLVPRSCATSRRGSTSGRMGWMLDAHGTPSRSNTRFSPRSAGRRFPTLGCTSPSSAEEHLREEGGRETGSAWLRRRRCQSWMAGSGKT
ncbi:hypothetical protein FKP32DRAFT_1598046 [Trametes sanguinea]|nr:hypothetical protein FKP32DRAFT_1598046 [Trametes sanguinea]